MIFSCEIGIAMISKIKAYREFKRNNYLQTPQKKQNKKTVLESTVLVRETGLEPVRDYHTPLKRARLPIPPLSHSVRNI